MFDDLSLAWKLWRWWVQLKEGTMNEDALLQALPVLLSAVGPTLILILRTNLAKVISPKWFPLISSVLSGLAAGMVGGGAAETTLAAGVGGLAVTAPPKVVRPDVTVRSDPPK